MKWLYTTGRLLGTCAVAIAAVLMIGCSSPPKIRSDYDRAADFSQYKSFGFAVPLGTDRANYQTIVSLHLKSAARRELELRGFQYTEASPQLLVNFNLKLSDKLRVSSYPSMYPYMGFGYGHGYYGYRYGFYAPWPMYDETVVTSYTEGTLNIDLVDAARKQMIWEGVSIGSVTEKDLDNLQAALDTTVTSIFKKFPIKAPAAK